MSKIMLTFTSIAVCLLAILGDSGSCRTKKGVVKKAPVETNDKLARGVWGGQHIRAEVTDSGADIEFDCAHGTIDQPIVLDGKEVLMSKENSRRSAVARFAGMKRATTAWFAMLAR